MSDSDAIATENGDRSPSLGGWMEELCDRAEAAWKAGRRPRIEEYLGDESEPARAVLLRALLVMELAYRRRDGEHVTLEEYRRRFPKHAELIDAVFQHVDSPTRQADSVDDLMTHSYCVATPDGGLGPPLGFGGHRQLQAVFTPGVVLQGRYTLERELGRGGMGQVYLGHDDILLRPVAIKVILPPGPGWCDGATTEVRFREESFAEEARLGANLTHIAIATVYDFGFHEGKPFTVFEYLAGETLGELLRRRGRLPLEEVRLILGPLAQALDFAHARHVVHRDLKPENIRATEQGAFKVLDLGLAKDFHRHADWAGFCGTPAYAAPEQAAGLPCDGRADQYALALIAYELLAGRRLFAACDARELLHLHLSVEPTWLEETLGDLPASVGQALARALSKSPDRRFASCGDLAVALGHVWDGKIARGYSSAEAPEDDLKRNLDGRPILTPLGARYSRRAWLAVTAACAVGSVGATAAVRLARHLSPIKVGVLQTQTEFQGDTGQAVINATLFAIDEINRSGGVLGRQIRPIVGDGQSDELVFVREARRLLDDEAVNVLFACLTSTHRRAVEPVVREYNRLLVYPGESEGLEQSPYVICLGSLPNQHVLPAIGWFQSTLGKRRFYFVGSDTVYARSVRAILGDFAPSLSVELVGESYVDPTDIVGWAIQTVREIESIEPDAIVSLLQGKTNLPFIHRLRTRRITPARIPTLSCTFTEHDLRNILGQMAGDYLCGHYYDSLATRENKRFLARLSEDPRLHDSPVVSGAMVAAYMGVRLWAAAIARAGSFEDLAAVRRAMVASSLPGPGGPVRIDPNVLCDAKYTRVAQVGQDREIAILWSSPAPLQPIAYPATRTRAQWDELIQGLHTRWGGYWANRESQRASLADDLRRL